MKISWSQERSKALAKDILFFVAGSLVYAVSVKMFTAPNQIASGGVTGLSIVLNYLFHTPIGTTAFLINIPIFLWAVTEIGYKMVAKTFVATLLSSAAIDLMGYVVPPYEGNPMLAAIFGGVLEGTGLALVFMRGDYGCHRHGGAPVRAAFPPPLHGKAHAWRGLCYYHIFGFCIPEHGKRIICADYHFCLNPAD